MDPLTETSSSKNVSLTSRSDRPVCFLVGGNLRKTILLPQKLHISWQHELGAAKLERVLLSVREVTRPMDASYGRQILGQYSNVHTSRTVILFSCATNDCLLSFLNILQTGYLVQNNYSPNKAT
jgi:hypothetical protein